MKFIQFKTFSSLNASFSRNFSQENLAHFPFKTSDRNASQQLTHLIAGDSVYRQMEMEFFEYLDEFTTR